MLTIFFGHNANLGFLTINVYFFFLYQPLIFIYIFFFSIFHCRVPNTNAEQDLFKFRYSYISISLYIYKYTYIYNYIHTYILYITDNPNLVVMFPKDSMFCAYKRFPNLMDLIVHADPYSINH